MGRFINCDGLIGSSNTVIGYNLYTYCNNTPVGKLDIDGNFVLTAGTLFGNVIGKIAGTIVSTIGAAIAGIGVVAGLAVGVVVTMIARNVVESIVSTKVTNSKDLKKSRKSNKKNDCNDSCYSVYILTEGGLGSKVQYVGRTNDIARREKEHSNSVRKELHLQHIADNISYNESRYLEQSLILLYGTLNRAKNKADKINNQISGIGKNNPKMSIYRSAGNLYNNLYYYAELLGQYRGREGDEVYVGEVVW